MDCTIFIQVINGSQHIVRTQHFDIKTAELTADFAPIMTKKNNACDTYIYMM